MHSATSTIAARGAEPMPSFRGRDRVPLGLQAGDVVENFRVLNRRAIPARGMTVFHLNHLPTGAEHVHVDCDDLENAFVLSFRTIPQSDMGVPHMLEHVVLCGSRNYPVRDPFMNMLKRSVNTYMNATTAPDHTSYMFSSTQVQDFCNLMEVYVDAVFFPLLRHVDYLQEGHRLGVAPDDDAAAPAFRHDGVVYNEMCGALGDASELFMQQLLTHMYPNSTYRFNSGGDPRAIRTSSHADLVAFHREFYHPSNALSLTYGDMPLAPTLRLLHDKAYRFFARELRPSWPVAPEPRRCHGLRVMVPVPPQPCIPLDRQDIVSVTWMLPASACHDPETDFLANLAAYLLLRGPASPMHQALIKGGLGDSYAPGTGFEGSLRDAFLSVGLANVRAADVPKVEAAIDATLKDVVATGFPVTRIASAWHQMEVGLRRIGTRVGIKLAAEIVAQWSHGADPVELVDIPKRIEVVSRHGRGDRRGDVPPSDPEFAAKINALLTAFIRDNLLDNPHRLTLRSRPDPEYMRRVAEDDRAHLAGLAADPRILARAQADEAALKTIADDAAAWEALADRLLPKIRLADLSPIQASSLPRTATATTQITAAPTNGLIYVNVDVDLRPFLADHALERLRLAPLFAALFARVGAADDSTEELAKRRELLLAGSGISSEVLVVGDDGARYRPRLLASFSWLRTNTDAALDLIRDMWHRPTFADRRRVESILGAEIDAFAASMSDQGHHIAELVAGAQLSARGAAAELLGGLSSLRAFQAARADLANGCLETQLHTFFSDALAVRHRRGGVQLALHAEEDAGLEQLMQRVRDVFGLADDDDAADDATVREPNAPESMTTMTPPLAYPHCATLVAVPAYIVVPAAQVSSIALAFRGVSREHADFAALRVMAALASANILLKLVREIGGAYGAGLHLSNAQITFTSYRDPRLQETLVAFGEATTWLVDTQFSAEQLEQAKVQLVAGFDAPIPPGRANLQYFGTGLTEATKQQIRTAVFGVQAADVARVARTYLCGTACSLVVVGGEPSAERVEALRGWDLRRVETEEPGASEDSEASSVED